MRTKKWMTALLGLLAVTACTPAICCTTDDSGSTIKPIEQFPSLEARSDNAATTGADSTGDDPAHDSQGTGDTNPNPSAPDPNPEEQNDNESGGGDGVSEPLTVAVFGDIQGSYTDVWPEAVAGAIQHPLDAALYVGDMIDTSNDWEIWRQTAPDIATFATPGNHEYTANAVRDAQWDALFSYPQNGPQTPWSTETCAFLHQEAMVDAARNTVYEADLGPLRVFSLNSNTREARREIAAANEVLRQHGCSTSRAPYGIWLEFQRDWLEKRLTAVEAAGEGEYTVVLFHHPVIASKSDRSGEMIRDAWAGTLSQADVVFNGHDHVYSRHEFSGSETQYLTLVSGRKFYPDTSMSDWNRAGVTPTKLIKRTSMYGILTVDTCLNFTAFTVQDRSRIDNFEVCR